MIVTVLTSTAKAHSLRKKELQVYIITYFLIRINSFPFYQNIFSDFWQSFF